LSTHQYPICIPLNQHSCYMPCPSHPPWLEHSIYSWKKVQFVKLLISKYITICLLFLCLLKFSVYVL
jgi:hypothetical protein